MGQQETKERKHGEKRKYKGRLLLHKGKGLRSSRTERGHNPGTVWQRIRSSVAELKAAGYDPLLGTEIGRLIIFDVLTETQVGAADLYAEVCGRFARYFVEGRRNAMSPAFQRGFRGYDSELQMHAESGTLKAYERRAKRAKKQWLRMQKCIPNTAAQDLLDLVCLDNQHLPNLYHDDFRRILDRIVKEFNGAGK